MLTNCIVLQRLFCCCLLGHYYHNAFTPSHSLCACLVVAFGPRRHNGLTPPNLGTHHTTPTIYDLLLRVLLLHVLGLPVRVLRPLQVLLLLQVLRVMLLHVLRLPVQVLRLPQVLLFLQVLRVTR